MEDKNDIGLQLKVLQYFERIESEDCTKVKYKCKIENCVKELSGKYISNLTKHASRLHPKFFETKILQKKSKLTLPQKRLKLIQEWVEIVTVNGRSFLHLADSGFQKVADEKLKELNDAGLGKDLSGPNYTAIKKHIAYLADEVKKNIKEEVKEQFVSLMIDFATKHRRSIMGVSLQFVRNGETVSRSIGMVRTLASNTGANVLNVLVELLQSFGIEKSRVVSVTTDNAANLSSMVKILNENVERERKAAETETAETETTETQTAETETAEKHDIEQNASVQQKIHSHEYFNVYDIDEEILRTIGDFSRDCGESCDDSESDSDGELDRILNDEGDFESLIRDLKNEYASLTLTVNGVKCAAHTLQLGVRDALNDKRSKIGPLICLCRAVCKILRKQSTLYVLEENQITIRVPGLDCETRWSSTYDMVRT